jgi:hypothetical protein
MADRLTLSDALRDGRIDEFVRQEERRGVGPVAKRKLDAAIKKLATTPMQSKDRTSRSTSRGGSRGK